jgi:hypothetical protein
MNNVHQENGYPYADISIECPSRSDRLTAFFRIFCAIPILLLLCLLVGMKTGKGTAIGGGIVFLPTLLMILFRNRYPKVWFEWSCYLTKYSTRVFSYLFLLRDEYPSVDEEQAVKLELRYPDVTTELHRGMPLVKWFLAIPHYIVLVFLFVGAIVATLIAWFSILFTGRYPAKQHAFVVAVFRWGLRVNAYAFLLLTDKYPPFKLF